jgi:hypothetical protein
MNRCCLVILAGIVISASLLTSCRTVEPVADFDDLIERLEQAGATVETTIRIVRNMHLSVRGVVIVVDGENVKVFEYEDGARAQLEFEAMTGPGPGLVFFEEDEPPAGEYVPRNRNCYHSGRFVVLYDGENENVLRELRTAVGKPSMLGR